MQMIILLSRAKHADTAYCGRLLEHLKAMFPGYVFCVGTPMSGRDTQVMVLPVLGAVGSGDPVQERPSPDLLDEMTAAVETFDHTGSWRTH
jgi:hypothetical protein